MIQDVVVIVGSLRKDSFTRKLAKAVVALAPPSLKFRFVEIGNLPFFNQDNENDDTPVVARFKADIAKADAVLFATPEYHRSEPGVLKNALEVASRPYGKSVWGGKPAAIISASVGALGGFGANHHLRQSLVAIDMPTMAQPEAYIGNVAQLLDAEGKIVNPDTVKFFETFLRKFEHWIDANSVAGESQTKAAA